MKWTQREEEVTALLANSHFVDTSSSLPLTFQTCANLKSVQEDDSLHRLMLEMIVAWKGTTRKPR
jgi:hypothetical protein